MMQCAKDLVELTFLSAAVHEGAFECLPADNVIIPVGANAADTLTDTTVRPTTFARFAGVAKAIFVLSVGTVTVYALEESTATQLFALGHDTPTRGLSPETLAVACHLIPLKM
jgi:stringent starvation protein B